MAVAVTVQIETRQGGNAVTHDTRLAMVLILAAACGGGVDPELIPGGGISDPGIDGDLYVHVIDEHTDAPLADAEVWIGDDISGKTDADGLFSASDLDGPQTVTVLASGYTSATWFGVDGANLTIPLSPRGLDYGQGRVSGTIEGFEDITVPAGRANIAIVGYSQNRDDDDPTNDIDQGDPAPNVCFNAGANEPCEWTMRTRSGQMTIVAYLGTMDADMNIEITGFAYQTGVVVEDGGLTEGVNLTMAGDGDLVRPDVSLPSAPEGTERVSAAVRLDLDDDGRLLVPVAGPLEVPVPDRGLLGADSYELIGFAAGGADGPASIRIDRGLESVDQASVGTFLAVPAGLSTDGATFAFEPVGGAAVHIIGVTEIGEEDAAWGAAVFDGSSEITLPAAVTLPDGELRFGLQAIEVPDLDVQDFAIDDLEDEVTRVSGDSVTFTR
jgi:hypothetical protein